MMACINAEVMDVIPLIQILLLIGGKVIRIPGDNKKNSIEMQIKRIILDVCI